MADSIHSTDTINGHSYPICFKTKKGQLGPGALSLGDAQDMGTPPAMSELIHQHRPASSYVVLKNAAHISNIEQAQAFTDAVMKFLPH